jgi:hypothetical protein
MKISEVGRIQKEMAQACAAVVVKKNKDYASREDAFQSFKIGSGIVRLLNIDAATPRGDALCCIVRKLARLCNLEHQSIATPANEPIEDTVRDLHVYLDLYYAMTAQDRAAKRRAR